jgi:3D (Asp-Asp-Asp) domain-containing protein
MMMSRKARVAAAAILAAVPIATPSTADAESSTGYCLSGTMADGTGVRAGSVAHNGYPLGTRLTITPSPTGQRRFVVRDRIGWGTELDFWLPSCGQAIAWGRRHVRVRVGWHRHRLRGTVKRITPGVVWRAMRFGV